MLPSRIKTMWRWGRRIGGSAFLLALLAGLFWLRGAIYDHFVRFPREQTALAALRADRQPVKESTGWKDFRGILHSHSFLSHDCQVSFPEILRVLQKTDRDFICLSDHCVNGRADFSAQWRGLHEGKLFVPGFEMKDGFMPFGVAPGTILSNSMEPAVLAKQISDHGGLLFFAHPEEPRDWQCRELDGMEIYNLHAQFKRGAGIRAFLPQLLVNQRRYPEQVLGAVLGGPAADIVQRWDRLNDRSRHLTGIAGNDCHQNTGVRILCTSSNSLRIEDTSPKLLREIKLNLLTRWLARRCFGPFAPGDELWHFQLDPYERLVRFVSTHVLAHELSEPAILDGLKAGRVFVAFDGLADSTGFIWTARNRSNRAVVGQSLLWSRDTQLHAAAPQQCRFTIFWGGQVVHRQEGRATDWRTPGPGVYRVVVELNIAGEWRPWIYSNPIWLLSNKPQLASSRDTPGPKTSGRAFTEVNEANEEAAVSSSPSVRSRRFGVVALSGCAESRNFEPLADWSNSPHTCKTRGSRPR